MSRVWTVPVVARAALGMVGALLIVASTLPTDWRVVSIGSRAYAGVATVGGNVWDVSTPLAVGIVLVALALAAAHGVDAVRRTPSGLAPLLTALLVGFALATALAMETSNARAADALAGLGVMAVGVAALPARSAAPREPGPRPGVSGSE
ncbi:hypothetical protein [Patulibacter americanus]|uniref:hypothetical protein n=1 Tax=Patulibacter americanus TaxID=588672 RepID=UPI0003B5C120|nr:hypothetical protein [Patulibacter americanus]